MHGEATAESKSLLVGAVMCWAGEYPVALGTFLLPFLPLSENMIAHGDGGRDVLLSL